MAAPGSVQSCIDVLQSYRDGDKFNRMFTQAEAMYGDVIQMPRTVSCQKYRANSPPVAPQEYSQIAILFLNCADIFRYLR